MRWVIIVVTHVDSSMLMSRLHFLCTVCIQIKNKEMVMYIRWTYLEDITCASLLLCFVFFPISVAEQTFYYNSTGTTNAKNLDNVPQLDLDPSVLLPESLLPCLWGWTVWLAARHGPSGSETAAPSGPCSPPARWPQSSHLGLGNRSCIQKCQSYHMGCIDNWYPAGQFNAFVCAFGLQLSSLPASCSTRLRVMIWRMRVETGVGGTLDSCPSPRTVKVLSPELPSEWRRDSSSFYSHKHHIDPSLSWAVKAQLRVGQQWRKECLDLKQLVSQLTENESATIW